MTTRRHEYNWSDDPDGKINDYDSMGVFECAVCGITDYDMYCFGGRCLRCHQDYRLQRNEGEEDL